MPVKKNCSFSNGYSPKKKDVKEISSPRALAGAQFARGGGTEGAETKRRRMGVGLRFEEYFWKIVVAFFEARCCE